MISNIECLKQSKHSDTQTSQVDQIIYSHTYPTL